jgi:hypothetical protein
VLTILDSDVGSEDDVIGCVDFSLAELGTAAVEGDEGVVTFKRDVVHNGRLHGYLTGKIQVQFCAVACRHKSDAVCALL